MRSVVGPSVPHINLVHCQVWEDNAITFEGGNNRGVPMVDQGVCQGMEPWSIAEFAILCNQQQIKIVMSTYYAVRTRAQADLVLM